MISSFLQYVSTIDNFLTLEKITIFSVISAIIFGVINIFLVRKTSVSEQEKMLFNIVTSNIDGAIYMLESLDDDNTNDSFTWSVVAEQLSAFHNIAIEISNPKLRDCYCAKLHYYILRISNIFKKIDDYKFFYGVKNYRDQPVKKLLIETNEKHNNISPNALLCIAQFISLFIGARGDYMFKG